MEKKEGTWSSVRGSTGICDGAGPGLFVGALGKRIFIMLFSSPKNGTCVMNYDVAIGERRGDRGGTRTAAAAAAEAERKMGNAGAASASAAAAVAVILSYRNFVALSPPSLSLSALPSHYLGFASDAASGRLWRWLHRFAPGL